MGLLTNDVMKSTGSECWGLPWLFVYSKQASQLLRCNGVENFGHSFLCSYLCDLKKNNNEKYTETCKFEKSTKTKEASNKQEKISTWDWVYWMCTFMLMISDMSDTWVPPHGHPMFSPNRKIRGVLPCEVIEYTSLSLIYIWRVQWARDILLWNLCHLLSPSVA